MVDFKISEDDGIIILSGHDVMDLVLIDRSSGKIYKLSKAEIKYLSKDEISVNNDIVKVSDVDIRTHNQVSKDYIEASTIYLKSLESCLPDPDSFEEGIYRSAIKAMKASKPLPLTKSQHNKKKSLIRELEKIRRGEKTNFSITRLGDLLSYYGLDIMDMIKDKYK